MQVNSVIKNLYRTEAYDFFNGLTPGIVKAQEKAPHDGAFSAASMPTRA
jgi:hypothetical protein